jgi:hypothetical protein
MWSSYGFTCFYILLATQLFTQEIKYLIHIIHKKINEGTRKGLKTRVIIQQKQQYIPLYI